MKKILNLFIFIPMVVISVVIMGLVFWAQVKGWIYYDGVWGNDTPQFIHYVFYHFKHPHFPVNAWDYLWHNGVPRAIDTSYIHFFFTSPLVAALGFYKAIKIFPLISLFIFAVFSYLLFYELSRSVILSLGMAISLVLGKGLYAALFSGGVVMSAISQAFFPIQFYFLARFYRRGTYRNLCLGGLASALGFYFHGMLMMFMGFIPSFIFVLFSTHQGESLISKRSVKNSLIFFLIALTAGALGSWPYLLQAFQGGSFSVLIPRVGPTTQVSTFIPLLEFTDQGIPIALVIGLMVLFVGSLIRRKSEMIRSSLPLIAVLFYGAFWFATYNFGLHPLAGIIFPGRFYWMWPLTLGALAAFFLLPLSRFEPQESFRRKLIKWSFFGIVKIGIFLLIIINLLPILTNKSLLEEKIRVNPWEDQDLVENYRNSSQLALSTIDPKNTNWRIWSHVPDFNMRWIVVSDVPLSGGYAHIYTRLSRLWEGWSYAVITRPNYDSQEIPREMAEQQALFFLDWYGIKYMNFSPGSGEWDLAPYLYQNEQYIDSLNSKPDKGFLRMRDGLTSEIVSPVNAPVVGFVGDDEGYMTFLKDIATLNLNTSYVIPVRLGGSLGGLNSDTLEAIQALVIYNYQSQDWGKIYKFVQNGGRVWIESGGNAPEREKGSLPEVFPIKSSRYGPLGSDWEPGGELLSKVDFSSLEKLVYRNTPWQVSYSLTDAVKPGANVLLTQKGYPIAVSQNVGQGKVVWTGANFWYRPEEYRKNGNKEIIFVKLLLEDLLDDLTSQRAQAQIERKVPEHITVSGQGFSGVTFKETNWPGWSAKVSSAGKTKSMPVLAAGPELMYIPVPKDMRAGEIKVSIDYQGDPFNWLAFFVSVISTLVVLLYIVFGRFIFRPFKPLENIVSNRFKGWTKGTSGWWKSDEDDEQ